MGKLTEQTIIMTVEEMINASGGDMNWAREEVSHMFDTIFSKEEWDDIMIKVMIRMADQQSKEQKCL